MDSAESFWRIASGGGLRVATQGCESHGILTEGLSTNNPEKRSGDHGAGVIASSRAESKTLPMRSQIQRRQALSCYSSGNSVQQKAERLATLRDQPFKSGSFLTGVPVDEKSTTDTSQHQSPPNLPIPESFWIAVAIEPSTPLSGSREVCRIGAMRHSRLGCGPECSEGFRIRPAITERLCPEGFRKGLRASYRRLEDVAVNVEPLESVKRSQNTVLRVGQAWCGNGGPFTKAPRRQPNVVKPKRKSLPIEIARGWSLPHVGREFVQGVAATLRQVFRHNVDKLAYAVKGTGWHYPKVTMGTLLLCLEERECLQKMIESG